MTKTESDMRNRGHIAMQSGSQISLLFFALRVVGSGLGVGLLLSYGSAFAQDRELLDKQAKGWNVNTAQLSDTAEPPTLNIEDAVARKDAEALLEDTEAPDKTAEAPDKTAEAQEYADTDTDEISEQAIDQAPLKTVEQNPSVATVREVKTKPTLDISPELRDSLERQFQQIRTLLETEDAFSESLGEVYLSYGISLQQAGRLDEARKMLVNALHIAKVNNGVNSIEQRPALRALFEMNLALKNTEDLESNARRIIWLEKKTPEQDDDYSFDIVIRLGNHFLDQYLQNPVVSELSLSYLNKAAKYFRHAVDRYGNRQLDELLMPYGELAYTHFLKSRIQVEVTRSFYQDTRQRNYTDLDKLDTPTSLSHSFAKSERYLLRYLKKAKQEKNLEHLIQALLNLGDLNLLFGRRSGAAEYYELAWVNAQNLPETHPIVVSFDSPAQLPAFRFAADRKRVVANNNVEVIPLTFDIDRDGSVKRVAREAVDGTTGSLLIRAKRAAKRLKFRPVIENGKVIATSRHQHDVRVVVKRRSQAG